MGLRAGRLGRVDRALRLCTLGSAAWRGVGGGDRQQGGFDLGIGLDGYFELSGFGWPDPNT